MTFKNLSIRKNPKKTGVDPGCHKKSVDKKFFDGNDTTEIIQQKVPAWMFARFESLGSTEKKLSFFNEHLPGEKRAMVKKYRNGKPI